MTKKRYRALVGLEYPTDPRIIARIKSGKTVPFEERHNRQVEAGEIVDDIPPECVPGLLERGKIAEVKEVLG